MADKRRLSYSPDSSGPGPEMERAWAQVYEDASDKDGVFIRDGQAYGIFGPKTRAVTPGGGEDWSIDTGYGLPHLVDGELILTRDERIISVAADTGEKNYIRELDGLLQAYADKTAYVLNQDEDTVSVLDVAEDSTVAELAFSNTNYQSGFIIPEYFIAFAGTVDANMLRAYQFRTDKIAWEYTSEFSFALRRVETYPEGITPNPLYIESEKALFIQNGQEDIAIDVETGEAMWQREEEAREGRVASDGERIYKRSDDTVVALSPDDGSVLWETNPLGAGQTFNKGLAVTDEHLYFTVGNEVAAADPSSGEVRNKFQISEDKMSPADLTVIGDRLYIRGENNFAEPVLIAVDPVA